MQEGEVVVSEIHVDSDNILKADDPLLTLVPQQLRGPLRVAQSRLLVEWMPPRNPPGGTGDPQEELLVDQDGDLMLERPHYSTYLLLDHCLASGLPIVGLQVWKASLLLSDYLLHHGSELLRDTAVLELGCGAGLCGVVAAAFASWVCCTGEVHYASSNLAVYETIVPVLVYYLSLNSKYIALAIISNSFAFTDGVIVQRLLWRRILVHFSSKVPPLDIDFGAYCRVS